MFAIALINIDQGLLISFCSRINKEGIFYSIDCLMDLLYPITP
jgi:hypothetical protein